MNTKLGRRKKEWYSNLRTLNWTHLSTLIPLLSTLPSTSFPHSCQGSPKSLRWNSTATCKFFLSSNYAVRQAQNTRPLPDKVARWQLWILKATRTERKGLSFQLHSLYWDRARRMFDHLCPLPGPPGRRPGSALPGGNESCWHCRSLTGTGHGGSIIVGSEKASITGAWGGSFPDWVAVGRALGTSGIRGEGLVISNFAG